MMDPFSGALFAGLGVILMMVGILPTILMVFALVYVALRVRDAKAETPDPDLGLKAAYWFLYTLGILILHVGLMVLFSHWFQQIVSTNNRNQFQNPVPMGKAGFPAPVPVPVASDEWSAESRTGWALILAGGLTSGAFFMIGAFGTRDSQWPTVRRVFVGGRLAIAGMFTIFAFVALVVLQFQKDVPPGGLFPTTLATLAVWVPSLAIHIFLFRWGGDPAYHVPPVEAPRRRRSRAYDEENEHTEADLIVEPPEEEEQPRRRSRTEETEDAPRLPDEEERPRRRRPRDDEE